MFAVSYHMGGNGHWMPSAAAYNQQWQVDHALAAAQVGGSSTLHWCLAIGMQTVAFSALTMHAGAILRLTVCDY
jgi:hypothetical protein